METYVYVLLVYAVVNLAVYYFYRRYQSRTIAPLGQDAEAAE